MSGSSLETSRSFFFNLLEYPDVTCASISRVCRGSSNSSSAPSEDAIHRKRVFESVNCASWWMAISACLYVVLSSGCSTYCRIVLFRSVTPSLMCLCGSSASIKCLLSSNSVEIGCSAQNLCYELNDAQATSRKVPVVVLRAVFWQACTSSTRSFSVPTSVQHSSQPVGQLHCTLPTQYLCLFSRCWGLAVWGFCCGSEVLRTSRSYAECRLKCKRLSRQLFTFAYKSSIF